MKRSDVVSAISRGFTSFEEIRKNGWLYVDKTEYLSRLIASVGSMYYCARPDGFGKTLTLSTLEALFQGKRELFKGLYIDGMDYDWKAYPVIHIDFGACGKKHATGA